MDNIDTKDIQAMLAPNETIELVTRPNKVRWLIIDNVAKTITLLFFGAIFFTVGLLILKGVIIPVDSEATKMPAIMFMVFGGIPILLAVCGLISRFARYKNIAYIVTDNRLIIRSGLLGVDYQEIRRDSILSINVNVTPFDKIMKPNTGTLIFGTASNPIIVNTQNNRGTNQNAFKFECIDNPYDLYKKLYQQNISVM